MWPEPPIDKERPWVKVMKAHHGTLSKGFFRGYRTTNPPTLQRARDAGFEEKFRLDEWRQYDVIQPGDERYPSKPGGANQYVVDKEEAEYQIWRAVQGK